MAHHSFLDELLTTRRMRTAPPSVKRLAEQHGGHAYEWQWAASGGVWIRFDRPYALAYYRPEDLAAATTEVA